MIYGIDWHAYARDAKRTLNPESGAQYLRIGLLSELGEVLSLYKKERWHGKPAGPDAWADELGDCFWYVTLLLESFGPEAFESGLRLASAGYEIWHGVHSWSGACNHLGALIWSPPRRDEIEACADVLYTLCLVADANNLSVGYILTENTTKLNRRFPNGFVAYAERSDLNATEA